MRIRTTPVPCSYGSAHVYSVWTQPDPDVYTDYGYYPYAWTPSHSEIADEEKTLYMRYRDGVRRRRWKPVKHLTWSLTVDHSAPTIVEGPYDYWSSKWARMLFQAYNEVDLGSVFAQTALIRLPAASAGHYDRWKAVKPTMATRANMFVCLAELRDIKRMWDILPGKHFNLRSWHSVLSYANGLHLNYNFGWKPFVKDVINTFTAADSFERRLARLLREQDRPLRKRFADKAPASLSENWTVSVPYSSSRWVDWTHQAQVKRASCFDFTYTLPKYSEKEMRWRAWLDALGLNPSIKNFWELVPWSFVVDWFVDVGGALETITPDWIEPWLEFHQACYSMKVTGELSAKMRIRANTGVFYTSPPFSLNYKYYIRSLGVPSFQMGDPTLDADKIRLGASLLYGLLR